MTVSARKISHLIATLALALALCTGVSSCGSSRHAVSAKEAASHTKPDNKHKAPQRRTEQSKSHISVDENSLHPLTARLLKEADKWLGTPYAWGGNDRNGVDCSGFVTQVYLRALEISLPRTSERQMQYCVPIAKKDLIPGDLVFFTVRGGNRVGHVGIYIGNGEMVHASSSKGVVVTPLSNPYFVSNYYSSGRIERYIALLDSKKGDRQVKPVPSPAKPQSPSIAKAEKNESSTATTKAGSKVSSRTGTAAKRTRGTAEKHAAKQSATVPLKQNDGFATPMPSQVFVSKNNVNTPSAPQPVKLPAPVAEEDDDETDSEFFD